MSSSYPRRLIITRAVPPPLRTPNLGKRPVGYRRHLVGSGGRSVLGDAERLDLAHHCKHPILLYREIDCQSVHTESIAVRDSRQCAAECWYVSEQRALEWNVGACAQGGDANSTNVQEDARSSIVAL